MTEALGPALEQALAYHRAPGMLAAAHGRPLPDGMMTLLRLAGGDQLLKAECAQACGETESEVAAAAVFFIQQVMFANGADSYRVLGVNPDAPDARIKEHYRWLVRWLHPDRNTDQWDSVYADRVNVAWQTLRLPDRRCEYDAGRVESAPGMDEVRRPRASPARVAMPEPALLSSRTVQQIPMLVLGGLGGLAVMVLLLMWVGAEQGVRKPVSDLATAPVEPPAALAADALDMLPAEAADRRAVPTEAPAAANLPTTPSPAPAPLAAAAAVSEPATPASSPVASVGGVARPGVEAPRPIPTVPDSPLLAEYSPSPPQRLPSASSRGGPAPRSVAPAAAPVTLVAASALASAPVPEPPTGQPAALLQEAQAYELVREFGVAYQAGDINALMRLFTPDARNNRGGRDAIVYDYQSLFSGTESRQLQLTPTGWIGRDEGGTLLANYRARVRSSGRLRAEVSEGTIRFDLRMVDGRARISVVRHNDGA